MIKSWITAALLAVTSLSAVANADGFAAGSTYNKAGFVTAVEDGRLWVFKEGSKELEEFKANGEPAFSVARIGEGPEGMTIKAVSEAVINEYNAAQ
jgi:hypothetical protein